jgi:hypothetical protein
MVIIPGNRDPSTFQIEGSVDAKPVYKPCEESNFYCHLRDYDTPQSGRWVPAFGRNMLPSCSWQIVEPGTAVVTTQNTTWFFTVVKTSNLKIISVLADDWVPAVQPVVSNHTDWDISSSLARMCNWILFNLKLFRESSSSIVCCDRKSGRSSPCRHEQELQGFCLQRFINFQCPQRVPLFVTFPLRPLETCD